MRVKFNFAFPLLAAACLAQPCRAFGQVDAFPPALVQDLSQGTSAIYLLDFEQAHMHFRHAIEQDPAHPAAYFFDLMCTWYELAYDSLSLRNPQKEKILEAQADLAIRKAEAYAKNPQTAAVGYLYWGGSLGAKGWYNVTRRNWVRAYFSGKKGYEHMKKVLELDPELYDAYLGVGMFEYYAATLGSALRALASFMVRGNKEEAVKYLNWAKDRSRFVRLEAAYFLWNTASEENRLDEAYERAVALKKSFPESPFFLWCEIFTVFQMKQWRKMLDLCDDYFLLADAGPQPEKQVNRYEKIFSKAFYHCGLASYQLGNVRGAKQFFDRTIDQKNEFEGWKTLAYLRRGEIFDLEGKRTEALVKYRAVLKYRDVYDSHKTARARIRKPYSTDSKAGILSGQSPLEPPH